MISETIFAAKVMSSTYRVHIRLAAGSHKRMGEGLMSRLGALGLREFLATYALQLHVVRRGVAQDSHGIFLDDVSEIDCDTGDSVTCG